MRAGRVVAVVVVLTLVVVGLGVWLVPDRSPSRPDSLASESASPLPDGWRWESFGNVAVAVPDDWGWGTAGAPWCIREPAEPPYVGRPGFVAAIACPRGPEATSTSTAGMHLWFSWSRPDVHAPADRGDRESRLVGDVVVSVLAPTDLRERILESAHTFDVDPSGCPASDPISVDPSIRPEHPSDVAEIDGVSAVAACKYAIQRPNSLYDSPPGAGLISSLRLEGQQARDAVSLIADAPEGGGPDRPDQCAPEIRYGSDVIVLHVQADDGVHDIVLRYSGCDHNGFDDGETIHTLTRAAVQPFVAGSNLVTGASTSGDLWAQR